MRNGKQRIMSGENRVCCSSIAKTEERKPSRYETEDLEVFFFKNIILVGEEEEAGV